MRKRGLLLVLIIERKLNESLANNGRPLFHCRDDMGRQEVEPA